MVKPERIMIITDSVSMPSEHVRYEDTWIYLFKNRFSSFDVIDRPAIGSTSMRLVQEGGGGRELLELYMPDRIILQLGLAECSPRLFRKRGFERKFINSYLPPRLRSRYVSFIKKRRVRNPEYVDVSPERFKKNIFNFAQRCASNGIELCIIKILRPTDIFIAKSPYIKKNIDLYNTIYENAAVKFNNVTIISPVKDSVDINGLCYDELHINKKGHKLYFKAVEKYMLSDGRQPDN